MLLKITPLINNSWHYTPEEDSAKGPMILNTKDIVYFDRLTDKAISVRSFAPPQPEVTDKQKIEQLKAILAPLDRLAETHGVAITEANRSDYEAAPHWRMGFGTNNAARKALSDFRVAGGINIDATRRELSEVAATKIVHPEALAIKGSFRDVVQQLGSTATPFIELHLSAADGKTLPVLFNTDHISKVTQELRGHAKPQTRIHFPSIAGPIAVDALQFSDYFGSYSHSHLDVEESLDQIISKTQLSASGQVKLSSRTNVMDVAKTSYRQHMCIPH